MVLMHTFVPPSSRGTGAGSEFVKQALEYIRSQGLKIIVYCPFIKSYLERHPGYADLVDNSGKAS